MYEYNGRIICRVLKWINKEVVKIKFILAHAISEEKQKYNSTLSLTSALGESG
jgi:hypothetical protein